MPQEPSPTLHCSFCQCGHLCLVPGGLSRTDGAIVRHSTEKQFGDTVGNLIMEKASTLFLNVSVKNKMGMFRK